MRIRQGHIRLNYTHTYLEYTGTDRKASPMIVPDTQAYKVSHFKEELISAENPE